MIKLALVGEDPNDTIAIRNLLRSKYERSITFKSLLKNKRGDQLKNARAEAALRIEYETLAPDIVLFIKDADALLSETKKITAVKTWFEKMNAMVDKKGILLLNIYELEALILADIETFNKLYATNISFKENVMYKANPKEFLKSKTYGLKKRYVESDCPFIFEKLSFEKIEAKCEYFRRFITNLNERLAS